MAFTPRYTPDSGNLVIGKGAFYIDRFENGVKTGERHLGNVISGGITNQDENAESYSGMDSEAALYKRTVKRRKPILKLVGEEFVPETVALLMMGDVGTLENTVNTPVVDEAIGLVKKGMYYKLVGRNVTDVTVKYGATDVGSAADAYEDEDFVVDDVTGRVYIVPGGAIANTDKIWVSYTPGDYSYQVVNAGTKGTIEAALRFVGDPTDGPITELEIWKANISPDGEIGLITDNFGNWSLQCEIMKDRVNHPNEPYYRQINRT